MVNRRPPSELKSRHLNIRLDEGLGKELDRVARQQEVSPSWVARRALEEYVQRHPATTPPTPATPPNGEEDVSRGF
jgi:predicted transcriptional regulator